MYTISVGSDLYAEFLNHVCVVLLLINDLHGALSATTLQRCGDFYVWSFFLSRSPTVDGDLLRLYRCVLSSDVLFGNLTVG
jgi:hypothetical protein